MIFLLFILILGFFLLIKGANYFVDGASGIAQLLKISPMIIGLTIVAFGTSLPEAMISISAALKGSNGIVLGNVIGSNIANISLVIGVTALIHPLKVEKDTIKREIPFTILSSMLLLILVLDKGLQFSNSKITREDGFILIFFFIIFIYYLLKAAKKSRRNFKEGIIFSQKSLGINIFDILRGLAGILIGGELVVRSSKNIAYSLGLSDMLVGLTIVALGTSLPELIISLTAAFKRQSQIAVGNIVGSNIFNILFVLGSSSILIPISVDQIVIIDLLFMIICTIILLIFSKTENRISRWEGFIFLISYILYMSYIMIRK